MLGVMIQSNTVIFFVAVASLGYLAHGYFALQDVLSITRAEYGRQLSDKQRTLIERNALISDLTTQLEAAEDDLRRTRDQNEDFEDELEDLSDELEELDKRVRLDEELLKKYSRVSFLNENYVPSQLKKIHRSYVLPDRDEQYFHADARPFLYDLIDAAQRQGHELFVSSAYRSFENQQELKGEFTRVYGQGANTFSADQGYSEHQLGTAVDLTTREIGGSHITFADTEAYAWLQENAHRYGFILSYPEGNAFYVFEPWHWRFVGKDLANYLKRKNLAFYQDTRSEREIIDEYLLDIFE